MNIVFDYEIFNQQKYGGISRYFVELAHAIYKKSHNVKIVSPYFINEYLGKEEKNILSTCKFKSLIKNNRYDYAEKVNYHFTEWYLKSRSVDILHETYYTNRQSKNKKAKRVITIHDMIPELYPQDLPEIDWLVNCKKNAITNSDLIVTVSHNTKADLVNLYPHTAEKIVVIHHGVKTNGNVELLNFKRTAPFILYVGNRIGYKNFDMLLDAFIQSKELNEKYQLICFGGGNFTESEVLKIKLSGNTNKVIQMNGSDSFLASLYQTADLFVYPSSYEGFGMPVLEAMASGCAVVCAASSSLPEVAGDAAVYFKPNNHQQFIHCILDVLSNTELRMDKIKKGIERVKEFSWDNCAEKTLMAYQNLLNKHD